MKSTNPVLTKLPQSQQQAGYGPQAGTYGNQYEGGAYGHNQGYAQQNPYAQQGAYGQQQGGYAPQGGYPQTGSRPITIDDIVTKTGITLAVIIAFALVNFAVGASGNIGLSTILTIVGAIGGLIAVLVSSFGNKYDSAVVTMIYAVFEGLFVGGISMMLSGFYFGDANAGSLILQAVLGTIGVFAGMLFVYKVGAIRVTPKFTRVLTGCIFGVLFLALGNLVLYFITGASPLRGDGPLAIIFSLVCIVLAALSFLVDFDTADKLVRMGAPSGMAWGVALGLAVTLVWLYTEILRLLAIFSRD